MRKIVCATLALLLLLTGCTAPAQEPTESFSQGIYEFTFAIEQIAGESTAAWEFVHTYNGEIVKSGHQIYYSLELFTFHTIQVKVSERGEPGNEFSGCYSVAICDGGKGRTKVKAISTDGRESIFLITCNVDLVGVQ